jgi:hypothetical protein
MKAQIATVIAKSSFLLLIFISGGIIDRTLAAPTNRKQGICREWRSQVDPSLRRVAVKDPALSESEILEGIDCLLRLRGRRSTGRFVGSTRSNYNSSEGYRSPKHPATVEIDALYYISYLFYENWQHADSVALYDEDTQESNSPRNVDRAFRSYRDWFERIKEIGLEEARRQKLDPLAGAGVSWS